jgi:thiamine-phosphate pyrophosphorylase
MAASGPELYLVIEASQSAAERLEACLARVGAASLLIVPAAGGELTAADARGLVEIAQRRGVAALIADDARLARTLKADGVHLAAGADGAITRYAEVREILGQRGIVGGEAGGSRHEAMELAEAGADYVAFAPDPELAADDAADERDDFTGWWAEVFEVPCVAMGAADADAARRLALLGADFIGITIPSAVPVADAADAVAAIADGAATVSG